jgi:hypothetical protein
MYIVYIYINNIIQVNTARYTVCPRIEFTTGEKKLFLILRKNFRGITFFASLETPISVIKMSFSKKNAERKKCRKIILLFFLKNSHDN